MTVKMSTVVDNQLIELTYTCDPKLKRMSIETTLEMFRAHPCTGKYSKPAAIKPFFHSVAHCKPTWVLNINCLYKKSGQLYDSRKGRSPLPQSAMSVCRLLCL